MKKALLICLLAVSHSISAQNIDFPDLQLMYRTTDPDSIDQFLLPKGYTVSTRTTSATPLRDNNWQCASDAGKVTTSIRKFETGNPSRYLSFETSDPVFYARLLNQLALADFTYRNSVTHERATELCFANKKNELVRILLGPAQESGFRNYRFIIHPANDILK